MKISNEQYVKQSLIEFENSYYRRVYYNDESWDWYKVYYDGLLYIDNTNFTEELETEYQKYVTRE